MFHRLNIYYNNMQLYLFSDVLIRPDIPLDPNFPFKSKHEPGNCAFTDCMCATYMNPVNNVIGSAHLRVYVNS
jgi:hypothetical protein